MEFSIHTFELTYFCGCRDYIRLFEAVNKQNTARTSKTESYYHKQLGMSIVSKCQTYTFLNKRGINRIRFYKLYNADPGQILQLKIKFVINPKILLQSEEHPYTKIIEPKDLPLIPDALNSLIQQLVPGYPDILECGKLTRIDYCTNLWFQSQEESDEYFHLLKKYFTPAKFHTDTYPNKEHHRKEPRKGEISISCKSYTLSIYQKQTQLLSTEYDYPPEEIENASGQLRIELRFKRKKLYSIIRESHSLDKECDFLIHIPPSALSLAIKNLTAMYGTGDFFKFSAAKEQILSSGYKDKTIDEMFHILENVNEKRTLDCYNTIFDSKPLKKHLKRFNCLGVSPVTIPFRYSHDRYPNLIRYLTGESMDYLKACL